jgi:hypothetical protein
MLALRSLDGLSPELAERQDLDPAVMLVGELAGCATWGFPEFLASFSAFPGFFFPFSGKRFPQLRPIESISPRLGRGLKPTVSTVSDMAGGPRWPCGG